MDDIIKTLLEEKNSLAKTDIQAHMDFLKKAGKLLHPNHYVIKLAQRWILPLTTCQIWSKKEGIVKEYLQLLKCLGLGLCKDKARLLFENANISLATLKHSFNHGSFKKSDFKKVIESEILPIFNEVRWILRYDSKTSFEGKLYSVVQSYMGSLQEFVKSET